MILLIDNYDSFTYNLADLFGQLGEEVHVVRNDAITPEEAEALAPTHLVVSPGRGRPAAAGATIAIVERLAGKVPLLGVCLGHQAIGQRFGGRVLRAPVPMHGKVSEISHTGAGLFHDVPTPLKATRYHSLIVERDGLPECLEITAQTADGLIMGLQHREHPIFGVQFHPESIASEHGHEILRNFLRTAGLKTAGGRGVRGQAA